MTARPERSRCICPPIIDLGTELRPNRTPDGEPITVTVGCRVHHLMADGQPAVDHEVPCACGNFADDRDCDLYFDSEGNPQHVCRTEGCAPILVADCGFTTDPNLG